MEKLVVKLPFKRTLMRRYQSEKIYTCSDKEQKGHNKEKKSSVKERIRKYRMRLKNDPNCHEKAEKLKAKKKEENKTYKEKVQQRRKSEPAYDEQVRKRERERKRLYRKQKAQNLEKKVTEAATGSNETNCLKEEGQERQIQIAQSESELID